MNRSISAITHIRNKQSGYELPTFQQSLQFDNEVLLHTVDRKSVTKIPFACTVVANEVYLHTAGFW